MVQGCGVGATHVTPPRQTVPAYRLSTAAALGCEYIDIRTVLLHINTTGDSIWFVTEIHLFPYEKIKSIYGGTNDDECMLKECQKYLKCT